MPAAYSEISAFLEFPLSNSSLLLASSFSFPYRILPLHLTFRLTLSLEASSIPIIQKKAAKPKEACVPFFRQCHIPYLGHASAEASQGLPDPLFSVGRVSLLAMKTGSD